MQSVTPAVGNAPTGNTLAALAIKADTLRYPFESSKSEVDYIQGTVAACLNARASERGVIKFIVREDGQETLTSKQLERVLNKPNPVQSRVDFMETCSHFHDCTGQAVLYFIRGDANLPAEIWVLPSFYVVALFEDAANPIPTSYRWADGRVITETENLCFVRQNSVKTAPYTGRGFLGDMIDNAILYDYVVSGQKNWFVSGGAPNVALVQPQGSILTSEQIGDMQKMWHDRYNPATGTSNIAVLPDGVKPENFGPQELNFNVSKDEIRDAIRESLQVPKIILGDTDDVNLNNGSTAMAIFDRTVVMRWGEKFANALECYFQENVNAKITVEIDPKVKDKFFELQTAVLSNSKNQVFQGDETRTRN